MLTFDTTHRQSAELKRLKGSRSKREWGSGSGLGWFLNPQGIYLNPFVEG